MRKSYYLIYGSLSKSKEDIKIYLDTKWDITCIEETSAGLESDTYYKYSGLYADELIIGDSENPLDQKIEDIKDIESDEYTKIEHIHKRQYISTVYIAFTKGKNADKLSRYKFIKNLFNQLDEVNIINDYFIEEIQG